MDDIQQDVNNIAETTVDDSSVAEETSVDTAATVDNQADAGDTEPKTVPYDRFAEVNAKTRQLELEAAQYKAQVEAYKSMGVQNQPQAAQTPELAQKELIKAQLAPFLKELAPELGLMSKDEFVRQQQDQALEQDLNRLEKTYNGKDGRPAFKRQEVVDFAVKNGLPTAELAYEQMNKQAIINWHVQQAMSKQKGLVTEGSDGSGSVNAGTTNDDLKQAAEKGDKQALHTYLKRVSGVGK